MKEDEAEFGRAWANGQIHTHTLLRVVTDIQIERWKTERDA